VSITKGDLCEVIGGVLGAKSPNLGLIVQVLAYVGDDPVFGRIWRCEAQYAELWRNQEGANAGHPNKTPPGQADFAQDWLRKLPPKTDNTDTTRTKDLETTE
jgi:hypothetical protein